MIHVDINECKGCRLCEKNCPLEAIQFVDGTILVGSNCVSCGACTRICPFQALEKRKDTSLLSCDHCPVGCEIPEGYVGACKRYSHIDGEIIRNRKLVVNGEEIKMTSEGLPDHPLISAVGSGTNYPCIKPAPQIVEDTIDGIDVVTVVTEAPLSYSGVKVKIDTNKHIGEEGARVKRDGKHVGLVITEEYGSKMISIGGASLLSGKNGMIVAKTIVDLANGRSIDLKIENGSIIKVQQGKAPVIDGKEEKYMRVGCGSATIGMFARILSDVVDEAIILDFHVVGLLSEHLAGKEVGMSYSGVVPKGRKSTVGRYFGNLGNGWGGTDIEDPKDAIVYIDMNVARAGAKILVTETTAQKYAIFEIQKDGSIQELDMTHEVKMCMDNITSNCEESKVSILYTGGTGGSARAGVTTTPKKLSDAVHQNKVKMTVAGAPAFILPGGGINFMVDVSKMIEDAITWTPTPATIAPVEYTMRKDTYEKIGGHMTHIISKEELLKALEVKEDD